MKVIRYQPVKGKSWFGLTCKPDFDEKNVVPRDKDTAYLKCKGVRDDILIFHVLELEDGRTYSAVDGWKCEEERGRVVEIDWNKEDKNRIAIRVLKKMVDDLEKRLDKDVPTKKDKNDVAKELFKIAMQRYDEIIANREKYFEAFIAETGLKPSECEIVERNTFDGCTIVRVQRRGKA